MTDVYNQAFQADVPDFLCRNPLNVDGAPSSLRFLDLSGNRLKVKDFFHDYNNPDDDMAAALRDRIDHLPAVSSHDAAARAALGGDVAHLVGRTDVHTQTVTQNRKLKSDPFGYVF